MKTHFLLQSAFENTIGQNDVHLFIPQYNNTPTQNHCEDTDHSAVIIGLNSSGTQTSIFRDNWGNSMVAGAMAAYIAR